MNTWHQTVKSIVKVVCSTAFVPLTAALPVSAAVLEVGDSGSYSTIQEAIDAASPGDTITVNGGSYAATVVNKPNLVLETGSSTAIIDCMGIGDGIVVTADGVIVRGFTIENCEHGIVLGDRDDGDRDEGDGVSETLVQRNTIRDSTEAGILTEKGSKNNDISGNKIHGGFNGIVITVESGPDNTLFRNSVRQCSNDAFTIDSNGNAVIRNFARFSGEQGYDTTSEGNVLIGNVAKNNNIGFIDFGSGNSYRRNRAEENEGDGFLVQPSEGDGFLVQPSGSGNTFHGNVSRRNDNGFQALNGNNSYVGNTSVKNQKDGFMIGESEGNTLDDNRSLSNGNFGYRDDTSGEETAGTANTYNNNKCASNTAGGSTPSGLCTPQI